MFDKGKVTDTCFSFLVNIWSCQLRSRKGDVKIPRYMIATRLRDSAPSTVLDRVKRLRYDSTFCVTGKFCFKWEVFA